MSEMSVTENVNVWTTRKLQMRDEKDDSDEDWRHDYHEWTESPFLLFRFVRVCRLHEITILP